MLYISVTYPLHIREHALHIRFCISWARVAHSRCRPARIQDRPASCSPTDALSPTASRADLARTLLAGAAGIEELIAIVEGALRPAALADASLELIRQDIRTL